VKDLAASRQRVRDEHRRDDHDDCDQAGPGGAGLGFQEPQHAVDTIFGGASAPLSRGWAKLLWREVSAVSPAPGGSQPLKWSSTPVTFDRSDHPANTVGVGLLQVVVTPTIYNIGGGRTLVDGGAGLNLLSPEVFHPM
jgi:hypothetical protein